MTKSAIAIVCAFVVLLCVGCKKADEATTTTGNPVTLTTPTKTSGAGQGAGATGSAPAGPQKVILGPGAGDAANRAGSKGGG